MADDKKKEKPTGWNFDAVEGIFVLIFFTIIFSSIMPTIFKYFSSGEISFYGLKFFGIFGFIKSNIIFFKSLAFAIVGASAIGAFVLNNKTNRILRQEKEKLYPKDTADLSLRSQEPIKNRQTERWGKIVELSESQNNSDWRLAIIEADIILDDLLERLHLPGDTMGEKLKAVEKSDFTTIEYAWEAHKFRNMIAHQGNDFLVNQREISRIISLYQAVFKEFYLI